MNRKKILNLFLITLPSVLFIILALFKPTLAAPAAEEVQTVPAAQQGQSIAGPQVIIRHDDRYIPRRVPAPRQAQLGVQTANITVNYNPAGCSGTVTAWPANAQAAFDHAVSIWEALITANQTIVVDACWRSDLGANTLGSAGPRLTRDFLNAPQAGTWYPMGLVNELAGSDIDPATAEISSNFSSTFSWYFGTDGNVPANQVDFVSVVLHELGHGLGFTGGMEVSGGLGTSQLSGFPVIYAHFTEDGNGVSLLDAATYPNNSAALANALTGQVGGGAYFNATHANAANGGSRVKLYTPNTWNPGSSFSHLDETFNNTPHSLMTFSLGNGESQHHPGSISLGILQDIGWTVEGTSLSISKSVSTANTPVQRGDAITYTIVISNGGNITATNVRITDTLPTDVNGTNLDTTVIVTPTESVTFTINATLDNNATYGSLITNTAYYSHTSGSGSNSASFTVEPAPPQPNLSITKTVTTANTPPLRGDAITYTIKVANSGGVDASNVRVTDTLPANVSGTNLDATVTVTASQSVIFTIPATVTMGAANGEVITNTAYYSHTTGNGSSSAAFTMANYGVDLSPDQSSSAAQGNTITYTLEVTNTGTTSDSFNLMASGETWTTTLSTNSVSLAAGVKAMVDVSVGVPMTASNGMSDTVTITVISSGKAAVTDTVTLTTTAQDLILSPLQNSPASAGPPNNPDKITIEINKPASGLTKGDFMVTIGNTNTMTATIVTLYERSSGYRLQVDPPTQTVTGLYDLMVKVTTPNGIVSDSEAKAVRYEDSDNVDVMLVIDRSGSMGGQPIIDARNASKLFVDFMQRGDLVGVASFESIANVNFQLTEITTGTQSNANTAIDAINAGGGTSIGAGLQAGQNELTARGQEEDPWAIVLLSDGQENTAPYVADILPSIVQTKTVVHSIGFAGANEALMLDMANQTGGTYNFAPSSSELGGIYNTIIGTVANRQTLKAASGTVAVGATNTLPVNVDSSVSDATFAVTWSGTGLINLSLQKPDGTIIQPADAIPPDIEYVSGGNYAYYRISGAALAQGTWNLLLQGGTTRQRNDVSYQASITADTDLTMDFYLDKSSYLTAEAIKMVVSLSDDQPIGGATVQVQVQRQGDQAVNTVTMYDDGLHDDGAANDGVYANIFGGTTESGTYDFSVSVSGTSTTGASFTRQASQSTFVNTNPVANATANLAITKSDSVDPVSVGTNITYVVSVTNRGAGDATNVNMTDDLPAGLTFVSATPDQGTCNNSGNTVACSLGTMANGATVQVTIVVSTSQAGTFTNTARVASADVADPDSTNNSASQTTTVGSTGTPSAGADLQVSVNPSSTSLMVGDQITYDVTVKNNGPDTAINIELVNALPTGIQAVQSTTLQGTCNQYGGLVNCNLAHLDSGASIIVKITGTTSQDGSGSNIATVSSNTTDPNSANNSVTHALSIAPVADLQLTKSASPNPVALGDEVNYTFTILNAGPSAASNVTLDDLLPAGMTFVSGSSDDLTCGQSNNQFSCVNSQLASGEQSVVTVVARVDQLGTITNTATISSTVQDPNTGNNSASATIVVVENVSQIDPATGGTLTVNDAQGNQTIIEVPAGAVSQATSLAFAASTPNSTPDGHSFAGHGFTLDAYQSGSQVDNFAFNAPVKVTIHYSDQDVNTLNEANLLLYYWDESSNQWVDAATSCNPTSTYEYQPSENKMSVELCHLTEFGLFATTIPPTAVTLGQFESDALPSSWPLFLMLISGTLLLAWRRRKE